MADIPYFLNPNPQPMGAGLPMPTFAAPAMPNVVSTNAPALPMPQMAPPTQLQTDTNKYNALINGGDAISHIHNPFLHGVARVADTAASVFGTVLPALRAVQTAIPGTSANHQLQIAQQGRQLANDQAQQQAQAGLLNTQAQTAHTQAATRLTTDQAQAAETPSGPEYDYHDTASGPVLVQKGTTTATPLTDSSGKPIAAPVKAATTPFELWQRQNPNGTVADYNALESKPLSAEAAAALNSTFDPLSMKHGIPAGQFKAGMTHAEALQLQGALNQSVARQQGDTHISVQIAGQDQRAANASTKNAPLDTNDPANQAAVQAVANGSLKMSDVFGRGATTAQKAQFAAAVKAVNPQFNSGDHDIENASRRYFVAGQGSTTLTAFNTAQTHLDILRQASDELHNGNITGFNSLANKYAQATGDPAPTDFNAVKNAVKGEVARALTGNVTVSEQAELDKDFNNASSPRQVAGVAHKYIQLIDGKKQAMRQTYDAAQRGQANFDGGTGGGGGNVIEYTRDASGKLVRK